MGRKTAKSEEKRIRKKQEKKLLKVAVEAVNKANQVPDPLDDFPAFRTFKNGELSVHFECKRIKDVDPAVVEWILKLEKENMESLYNSCEWGWDEKKKNSEMLEDRAWYLIAYKDENTPVAFSHFRFDLDYGVEVLYCYEIQLEASVRRHKLGKFMVQLLELIAFKNMMRKVVLTILKHNSQAMEFFSSLKYTLDDSNPDDFGEEYCYLILSKANKKHPAYVTGSIEIPMS